MGRKPIGNRAMSGKEYQRRYWFRRFVEENGKAETGQELRVAKARIAELEARVADLERPAGEAKRDRIRREGAIEAAITVDDLPQTYKEKYAVLQRKFEREKAETVRQLVNEQVKKWHKEYWLPTHTKLVKDAERVLNMRRNGIMPKSTFKKILRCLHSDTRSNITERWLNEAFQEFKDLERVLVKEEPAPESLVGSLPNSLDAWDAMRRQATEERRTRRNVARR
ncbi:MAG: hypothetical protein AB7S93_09695 [Xanthobacteraceae bacterium]